jgi:hypothetical protein
MLRRLRRRNRLLICRLPGWWLTVTQRDHWRLSDIGIERGIVSDVRADGGNALERGLHIDREVRLLALLVVFRDRNLNRGGRGGNDHARHLHPGALHRVPNHLRVVRVPVEEDELLNGEAQRLQIRCASECVGATLDGRGWRRRLCGVIFRRGKEVGLRQGLDRRIPVHAAMVLGVEVLRSLFDLRLGLWRSELGRTGQEPGRALDVWRSLLRIGLSQKIGVNESIAHLRELCVWVGLQVTGEGCDRLSGRWEGRSLRNRPIQSGSCRRKMDDCERCRYRDEDLLREMKICVSIAQHEWNRYYWRKSGFTPEW